MTVSRELARYKIDLVGVQKVRWEEIENHELGIGLLCVRESYQQLSGLSLLEIGCHT
jgi:hypothetical protein